MRLDRKIHFPIWLGLFSVAFAALPIQVGAREYGEIMTVHAGDVDSSGRVTEDCWVKIKRESDKSITDWISVRTGASIYQPNGCSILLSAYVSGKRIGYDTVSNAFQNICLADKMDC